MFFVRLKSIVKDRIKHNGIIFRCLDKTYRLINSIPRLKWGLGSLPDFIIIGGQKCGTTSLYHYLIQHPKIKGATTKEISYFSGHYDKGINWYRSHFPLFKGDCLTGEASTSYMYYDFPARRIKQDLPDVKIIVLLRDRVDRTYSDYQHQVRAGRETRQFNEITKLDYIFTSLSKTGAELGRKRNKEHYENSAYFMMSNYYERLKYWFEIFHKDKTGKSPILVIKSEDLFTNPEETTNKVFNFLGLENHKLKKYKNMFKGGYTSKVSPKIRKEIEKGFKGDKERLKELTGVDI